MIWFASNANAEYPKEDIPQVETRLVPNIGLARPFIHRLFVLINSEALLLVRVVAADGHRDGKHGNLHHYQEARLHRRFHVGQVEDGHASMSHEHGLENSSCHTGARDRGRNGIILQVQNNYEQLVDEAEHYQDATQSPRPAAGELQGIAAPGMVEKKGQRLLDRRLFRCSLGKSP
ncbi:hypothetical protein BKA56DRAFT_609098 [Ilyonectria sp. MPI-CAGE-AT-0026]|nr:hypothetical protein BKA56DRAFT_609098 [Ilyonectria sp. MPI-CAGE-AT-0026]